MGFDRIAAKLNEQGIKPRRGARLWGLTVNNIQTGRARKEGATQLDIKDPRMAGA